MFFFEICKFFSKKMQFWNDFIKTNNHFAYFSRIDWLPRTRIRAARSLIYLPFTLYSVLCTLYYFVVLFAYLKKKQYLCTRF